MIRLPEFKLSKRPYAVDLDSLHVDEFPRADGSTGCRGQVDALWFRRRGGRTVACIGFLWDYQSPRPADAAAFLAAHDDGRYGGECLARWDGSNLWAPTMPHHVAEQRLLVLRAALDGFPEVPEPFKAGGWWTFHG